MTYSIDLANETNNPIMAHFMRNEPMDAWDIQVTVGNFKTEAAAKRAIEAIVEFLGGQENMLQS